MDLFFLKTCNFRDAQPRLIHQEKEGLLCQLEPMARYGTRPCNNTRCILCEKERKKTSQLKNDTTTTTIMVGADFTQQQIHCFLNTYQAILNCPAVRI